MTLPLEAVLNHYGIDAVGTGWVKVLCPVHSEDRPSCSVNLETGWFHCFACGEKGTAVDIIRKREGLSREAAESFATQVIGVSGEGLQRDVRGFSGRHVSGGSGFRPGFRQGVRAGFRGDARPGP